MFTCIIKDNGEKSVIKLTYENLFRELKNIPDSEILVSTDWFAALPKAKNKFVCLVEADCLVNSGYFESLKGHLTKNPQLGKLGILSTSTAVNNWAVRFYGYHLGDNYTDGVIPNSEKKGTNLPFYTIQVAYIPGAVIRTNMLRKIIDEVKLDGTDTNLINLSTKLSFAFWNKNYMVNIAPHSTYVSTEEYINDIGHPKLEPGKLVEKFRSESI